MLKFKEKRDLTRARSRLCILRKNESRKTPNVAVDAGANALDGTKKPVHFAVEKQAKAQKVHHRRSLGGYHVT